MIRIILTIPRVKRLTRYAENRFKGLLSSLRAFRRISDPEALHAIRVEVKKIKTLLNLLGFSIHEFSRHKRFIPFRNIFRRAGEIRQSVVFGELMERYSITGITTAFLPGSLQLRRAFQLDTDRFIRTVKRERRRLRPYFKQVKAVEVTRYRKHQRSFLKQLIFPVFGHDRLHPARKISKEIIYLESILAHKHAKPFYVALDEAIGGWHDKQNLLIALKNELGDEDVRRLAEACKKDTKNLKRLIKHHYKHPR